MLLTQLQISWGPLEFRRKKAKSACLQEGHVLGSWSRFHILPWAQGKSRLSLNYSISFLAFSQVLAGALSLANLFPGSSRACALPLSDLFPRLFQASPLPLVWLPFWLLHMPHSSAQSFGFYCTCAYPLCRLGLYCVHSLKGISLCVPLLVTRVEWRHLLPGVTEKRLSCQSDCETVLS